MHADEFSTQLAVVHVQMCEQICDAMCELAREGLLHCDLAARNVLVASISPIHVKVNTQCMLAQHRVFHPTGIGNAMGVLLCYDLAPFC